MKTLFTTKMINVGGRKGQSYAEDHSLTLKIAPPGTSDVDATNPEQLFAAGYSACFNSALDILKRQQQIKGESTVTAIVHLVEQAPLDFVLKVELEGHIEGLSIEETQKLLELTHTVCPYSKATKGNIEVTVKAV